jgi:hypothetical protein
MDQALWIAKRVSPLLQPAQFGWFLVWNNLDGPPFPQHFHRDARFQDLIEDGVNVWF